MRSPPKAPGAALRPKAPYFAPGTCLVEEHRDKLHKCCSMSKRGMLLRFSVTVHDLGSALREGLELTDDDQLFLENHLLELQMAYAGWKARYRTGTRHQKRRAAQSQTPPS
jgi:hypothetical protein